jgi:hypothetical protein
MLFLAPRSSTEGNSPDEALNKVLKNNYRNKMNIATKEALTKILNEVVEDYNNSPHGSLLGFTPNEAYSNEKTDLPTTFKRHVKIEETLTETFVI